MANFFDILSGSAAKSASEQASQIAATGQKKNIGQLTAYGNTQPDVYGNIASAYDPYVQGGGQAYQAGLTGLGLAGTPDQQRQFQDFYRNTPGYQFAFDQGNQALQRQQQAGAGGGAGGRAMKEAIRYGQGYADTRFQDYLRTLLGLGQQGQQAVGQRAGLQGQGVQNQLLTRTTAFGAPQPSTLAAQGLVAGAQAEQPGTQGLVNSGVQLAGAALGGIPGMGTGGYLFGGSTPAAQPGVQYYPNNSITAG